MTLLTYSHHFLWTVSIPFLCNIISLPLNCKPHNSNSMYNVYVTIMGKGQVYLMENICPELYEDLTLIRVSLMDSYCDIKSLEDDLLIDGNLYVVPLITTDLKLSWSYDGVDEKEFSKYGGLINIDGYISSRLKTPFLVQETNYRYLMQMFVIELPDDEQFNPAKLQLAKLEDDVNFIPYGILIDNVFYDRERIEPLQKFQYENLGGKIWIYED